MDILFILFGIMLLITGLVCSVLPVLPGPPLSYVGLILLHLSTKFEFSFPILLIYGILTIAVVIIDYLVPVYGTKKMGGTKYGIWGSTIGLFVGLFLFPPLGIIIGLFAGAFIGEIINKQTTQTALASAVGSFLGFLFGTLLKLILCVLMIYQTVIQLFN